MKTTIESEVEIRNTEAVALIDAWLTDHAWWADIRAIDFALDVRAVLADPEEAQAEEATTDETPKDDSLTSAAAAT